MACFHKVSGAHDQSCCASIPQVLIDLGQGKAAGGLGGKPLPRLCRRLLEVSGIVPLETPCRPGPGGFWKPLQALAGPWKVLGAFGDLWRPLEPLLLGLRFLVPKFARRRGPDPIRSTLEKTNLRTELRPGLGCMTFLGTSTGLEENSSRPLLQYPWLWEGGRATWIDLRHRCRGA